MDKYHLTEEAWWSASDLSKATLEEGKIEVEITISWRERESCQCCASERLDFQRIISRAGVRWEGGYEY
jgi:hypothetical protein